MRNEWMKYSLSLFFIFTLHSLVSADAPECEEKTLGTVYIEDYVQFKCIQTADLIGYSPIGCAPNNSASGPIVALNQEHFTQHFVFKCVAGEADGFTEVEYTITHCLDEHEKRIDIGETYTDPNNKEGQDTVIECTRLENGAVRKTVLKSTYCEDSKGMQRSDGSTWIEESPKEANKSIQSGVKVECQNLGKYLKGVQIACIPKGQPELLIGQRAKISGRWLECTRNGTEKGGRAILREVAAPSCSIFGKTFEDGQKFSDDKGNTFYVCSEGKAKVEYCQFTGERIEIDSFRYFGDKPCFCQADGGLIEANGIAGCTTTNKSLIHFGQSFIDDHVKQLCNYKIIERRVVVVLKALACLDEDRIIEIGGQLVTGKTGKKCVLIGDKCQLVDMSKEEVERYSAAHGEEFSVVGQRSGKKRGPRMKKMKKKISVKQAGSATGSKNSPVVPTGSATNLIGTSITAAEETINKEMTLKSTDESKTTAEAFKKTTTTTTTSTSSTTTANQETASEERASMATSTLAKDQSGKVFMSGDKGEQHQKVNHGPIFGEADLNQQSTGTGVPAITTTEQKSSDVKHHGAIIGEAGLNQQSTGTGVPAITTTEQKSGKVKVGASSSSSNKHDPILGEADLDNIPATTTEPESSSKKISQPFTAKQHGAIIGQAGFDQQKTQTVIPVATTKQKLNKETSTSDIDKVTGISSKIDHVSILGEAGLKDHGTRKDIPVTTTTTKLLSAEKDAASALARRSTTSVTGSVVEESHLLINHGAILGEADLNGQGTKTEIPATTTTTQKSSSKKTSVLSDATTTSSKIDHEPISEKVDLDVQKTGSSIPTTTTIRKVSNNKEISLLADDINNVQSTSSKLVHDPILGEAGLNKLSTATDIPATTTEQKSSSKTIGQSTGAKHHDAIIGEADLNGKTTGIGIPASTTEQKPSNKRLSESTVAKHHGTIRGEADLDGQTTGVSIPAATTKQKSSSKTWSEPNALKHHDVLFGEADLHGESTATKIPAELTKQTSSSKRFSKSTDAKHHDAIIGEDDLNEHSTTTTTRQKSSSDKNSQPSHIKEISSTSSKIDHGPVVGVGEQRSTLIEPLTTTKELTGVASSDPVTEEPSRPRNRGPILAEDGLDDTVATTEQESSSELTTTTTIISSTTRGTGSEKKQKQEITVGTDEWRDTTTDTGKTTGQEVMTDSTRTSSITNVKIAKASTAADVTTTAATRLSTKEETTTEPRTMTTITKASIPSTSTVSEGPTTTTTQQEPTSPRRKPTRSPTSRSGRVFMSADLQETIDRGPILGEGDLDKQKTTTSTGSNRINRLSTDQELIKDLNPLVVSKIDDGSKEVDEQVQITSKPEQDNKLNLDAKETTLEHEEELVKQPGSITMRTSIGSTGSGLLGSAATDDAKLTDSRSRQNVGTSSTTNGASLKDNDHDHNQDVKTSFHPDRTTVMPKTNTKTLVTLSDAVKHLISQGQDDSTGQTGHPIMEQDQAVHPAEVVKTQHDQTTKLPTGKEATSTGFPIQSSTHIDHKDVSSTNTTKLVGSTDDATTDPTTKSLLVATRLAKVDTHGPSEEHTDKPHPEKHETTLKIDKIELETSPKPVEVERKVDVITKETPITMASQTKQEPILKETVETLSTSIAAATTTDSGSTRGQIDLVKPDLDEKIAEPADNDVLATAKTLNTTSVTSTRSETVPVTTETSLIKKIGTSLRQEAIETTADVKIQTETIKLIKKIDPAGSTVATLKQDSTVHQKPQLIEKITPELSNTQDQTKKPILISKIKPETSEAATVQQETPALHVRITSEAPIGTNTRTEEQTKGSLKNINPVVTPAAPAKQETTVYQEKRPSTTSTTTGSGAEDVFAIHSSTTIKEKQPKTIIWPSELPPVKLNPAGTTENSDVFIDVPVKSEKPPQKALKPVIGHRVFLSGIKETSKKPVDIEIQEPVPIHSHVNPQGPAVEVKDPGLNQEKKSFEVHVPQEQKIPSNQALLGSVSEQRDSKERSDKTESSEEDEEHEAQNRPGTKPCELLDTSSGEESPCTPCTAHRANRLRLPPCAQVELGDAARANLQMRAEMLEEKMLRLREQVSDMYFDLRELVQSILCLK